MCVCRECARGKIWQCHSCGRKFPLREIYISKAGYYCTECLQKSVEGTESFVQQDWLIALGSKGGAALSNSLFNYTGIFPEDSPVFDDGLPDEYVGDGLDGEDDYVGDGLD